METLPIPATQKPAIARAILEDESSQNGEHLWDGERLLFYCPLQAPQPPARPAVRVRDLLPADVRIPTFGEYLALTGSGASGADCPAERRAALLRAYEAHTIADLVRVLPDSATIGRAR
ncbi:MAG TPA: hypothetical protein VH916_13715 [Dehalococcoidia bacterium]|jgi:hypothetical protein